PDRGSAPPAPPGSITFRRVRDEDRSEGGARHVSGRQIGSCVSACKIDPPYCLICKCYQTGCEGTLSFGVKACSRRGPVGGSEPSTGPGMCLSVVVIPVLTRSFSAALVRSASK